MRVLDRTPVLSPDEVVISKEVEGDIKRLASKLVPRTAAIDARWRRRITSIFGKELDPPRLRALASINPGTWFELLAGGKISEFLEQVEYHGRRLAKLDVSPNNALASLKRYEEALVPDLKRFFPKNHQSYVSALDHLYFCVKLTLNNAYYRVRDLEAQAFYEVFQDQLESLSGHDLMHRVLETLMGTFNAQAGVILLREPDSTSLVVRAWKGIGRKLAEEFNTTVGRGLAGRIAKSGEPLVVVDVRKERLIRSRAVRKAFRSVWGVPFTVRGKVTGVLQLGFSQEYYCLPREMTLLEAIAERCALAIDKAQLLEELHDREEKIRRLGEHMLRVEEEERRRISRELHDEVGQSMLVIRLYLEMVQANLPAEAAHLAGKLDETQQLAEQTIREMRRLISALSPNVLEELGLPASIRQFVTTFTRTFAGRVKVRMSGLDKLPQGSQIMLYRLVQECFSNVIKHSKAQTVALEVGRKNGLIRLKIQDDGVGFNPTQASRKRDSFGLTGMRERVALLGGEIDIQSNLGKGTRVQIAIPV